jgi:hypothetical protein
MIRRVFVVEARGRMRSCNMRLGIGKGWNPRSSWKSESLGVYDAEESRDESSNPSPELKCSKMSRKKKTRKGWQRGSARIRRSRSASMPGRQCGEPEELQRGTGVLEEGRGRRMAWTAGRV